MINSNLGRISHRFRDMAIYSLKTFTENCGQTAADRDIDSLQKVDSALSAGAIADRLQLIV